MRTLAREGYPVSRACALVGLPRSSYYYVATEEPAELVDRVREVARAYTMYGSRRIAAELRREPYNLVINRKRVQTITRSEGLLRTRCSRGPRTTNSGHRLRRYPNLIKAHPATHPDHIWVADITYIRLEHRFVYLAVVLDVYTRLVRGWYLGRRLDNSLSIGALCMALKQGSPSIHHSDQGVQYAALGYVAILEAHGAKISMSAKSSPHENGYAERFMRTIKEEEVYLSDYRSLEEASQQIGHFITEVYNRKRIHSALGYLTPVEFEQAYHRTQAPLSEP